MASSFRIVMHENSENLHLRLIGDFDGSSAFELLEVLKDRAHAVKKVFIQTSGLGEVHPFGLGVFEKRASELKENLQKIHFTGDKPKLVSPDQSLCLKTRHHSTAEKNGKGDSVRGSRAFQDWG
jgi:anti-anti-sigma regulatory factor